jgi:hypothetical protein
VPELLDSIPEKEKEKYLSPIISDELRIAVPIQLNLREVKVIAGVTQLIDGRSYR